jgi:small subunit ribosomal protein S6
VPTYETLFITLPTLSEDEEKASVAPLAQIVSERGVMVANERIGRRRLAYPIKKFEDGVYTRFLYDAEETLPRELERRLRISDKVLRHMTIRLEEDWAVAAKEQAVRDAEARVEAEAARLAAEAAGVALANAPVPTESVVAESVVAESEEAEPTSEPEAEAEGDDARE